MDTRYVLAIDQSTQGTKAVLFSNAGHLIAKTARPHRQIIHDNGFVEHDGEEIMANVLAVIREVVEMAGVEPGEVACLGISNQRETCIAWDRRTGLPLYNAIVWQCSRAKDICAQMEADDPHIAQRVLELSGMNLSPYFSAGKMAWLVRNVPAVADAAERGIAALPALGIPLGRGGSLVFRLQLSRRRNRPRLTADRLLIQLCPVRRLVRGLLHWNSLTILSRKRRQEKR